MSEANKALLRRAWIAYNQGDEDEFAACLTSDWKEYGSPEASEYGTLEDERRTMREHRNAFPDKHAEIHMILADENSVACFLTVRATHTGKYLGLEPTGKTIIVHEMMFNRVRDGKICETYAMETGPCFYEQITGKKIPEKLDNLG
ncbi:MAG: ester cyclase [Anaerolineales bacterium]